ncbi:hypothetical protein AB0919_45360 [Streptomyces sp. NPDC046994]|uniref:hypothetical protein n=1 Tax=Streptomyces sp. NPDC046994 TaxID=3155735 RepID=UPI0034515266
MPIEKVSAKAVHASAFGERRGFISPRGGLVERRDKSENLYICFTLLICTEIKIDEFFSDMKWREFEVWAEGEDIKTLQAAFPDGIDGLTKEKAAVIIDVADEWHSNYKNEDGDWVHKVAIRPRSITLPNSTA